MYPMLKHCPQNRMRNRTRSMQVRQLHRSKKREYRRRSCWCYRPCCHWPRPSFWANWLDLHSFRGLIAPSFRRQSFGLSPLDFTIPIGLVGLWLAYFLTQLEKRPLMPPNAPHLEEALEHGRE